MIKQHNGLGRLADIAFIAEQTGRSVAELDTHSTWSLAWMRRDLEAGVAV